MREGLLKKGEGKIDISDFQPGLYLLKIVENDDSICVGRFLKE